MGQMDQPISYECARCPRCRWKWVVALVATILSLAAVGVWYCLPYLEGEAEYEGLREIAYAKGAEANEDQGADDGASVPNGDASDEPMDRTIDWEALRAVNADVIGWIYVPGTPIDYPVVQAPAGDPTKYLRTTFEGKVSWPNNQGTIYLGCDNAGLGFDSPCCYLYGHQQFNDSMFSAFKDNGKLDALLSHDQIYVFTPEGSIHLEAFAGNVIDANVDRVVTGFADRAELNAWLDDKLAESEAVAYDPGEVDQLWTFCTCSYTTYARERTLTYARVVEDSREGRHSALPVSD